ncbi:hypothetical protein [Novosphingobium malaysiense]|nr:hypothetical protein [Novosphingobium malaysiense]
MEGVILGWIALIALASLPRMLFPITPVRDLGDLAEIVLPYACIAIAPIMGYRFAMHRFGRDLQCKDGTAAAPITSSERYSGKSGANYGPYGFMASLLVGILLNVPFRAFEFLLSVPAMNSNAPAWGTTLFHVMAFDVCLMSFLYTVCFVLALRTIPLFPGMLAVVWGIDITMQFVIANAVSASPHLPADVAAAVSDILQGNIKKVLISVAVWLPYLLLSRRVQVTYRRRSALA